MKKNHAFTYQAQYSLSHEPIGTEQTVLLCFHGYGQLSEFFIRKFLPYASEQVLVLAPEGTNYQYLKDYTGRVGANWMTRHERELAISNNHSYLDSLVDGVLGKFARRPRLLVLGFSQGAATATRWAASWQGQVDQLILWAGAFAHDLAMKDAKTKFEHTKIHMAFGDQDEFLTVEGLEKQRNFLTEMGKEAEEWRFSGGHEIPTQILESLMVKII